MKKKSTRKQYIYIYVYICENNALCGTVIPFQKQTAFLQFTKQKKKRKQRNCNSNSEAAAKEKHSKKEKQENRFKQKGV